jgi:hypothetical protein
MIALRSSGDDDDSDGWSSDNDTSNKNHEKLKSGESNEEKTESDYVEEKTHFNSPVKSDIFLKVTEEKVKNIDTNTMQKINDDSDKNHSWTDDDDLEEKFSESEKRRQQRDKVI